ncbi:ORF96 VP39capsid [Cydia pomonella granulovirus]|uniref:ORF96 VP39capsid n=2 Tax=Cydia pomonella granulosis virus TaxID=28289 RepID=Q91EV9_GVCPM|nr:ORF96 VP39capsid [Cydia pomonella granulovirus]AAK70756.1 ORF96 VP39capsid [Cydia pomonella granulovirus]AIU37022.1 ORF96 vp39 capsid [Cydia pomonella granulovirus]AIU37164.1 ORF96 vp39 capsid [Cydia pomonella granulovirus]AIU37303.1 ORF96 vp39 capsid [Cydia pomonella granulovirus]QDW81156.1 capsid [Cydia pomonella granulovirus]
MDVVTYEPCELNNYCVFQGVMVDIMRCNDYGTQCSSDAYNSRSDGTFICNYHLGKYFRIRKSRFEIPSGKDNRSFKMLIGQSLIPQSATDRVLIPPTHESHFNTTNRSAMEKFVIYTIYEDKEGLDKLCKQLVDQEFFQQPTWVKLQFNINTILGLVSPSMLCKVVANNGSTRTFSQQTNFEGYPPFLRNLITQLVRPKVLTISGTDINIMEFDTCTFTSEGLTVPNLHNPNQPVRIDNPILQPKFSLRSVVEFDGRATLEQRALDTYDDVLLTRPLINGVQTVV